MHKLCLANPEYRYDRDVYHRYTMDLSSLKDGSELETFVGRGSGINEGEGMGALEGWAKGLVGRFLSLKNRPIYNKLCEIVEADLLTMLQQRVPELNLRRTAFSSPGDAPAEHFFASADGKCEGHVAGYKGGKIDWLTTCSFYNEAMGFGNVRIDGWTDRSTRAPHVAVHLCIIFNVRCYNIFRLHWQAA